MQTIFFEVGPAVWEEWSKKKKKQKKETHVEKNGKNTHYHGNMKDEKKKEHWRKVGFWQSCDLNLCKDLIDILDGQS